jgi:hypothetical protein
MRERGWGVGVMRERGGCWGMGKRSGSGAKRPEIVERKAGPWGS